MSKRIRRHLRYVENLRELFNELGNSVQILADRKRTPGQLDLALSTVQNLLADLRNAYPRSVALGHLDDTGCKFMDVDALHVTKDGRVLVMEWKRAEQTAEQDELVEHGVVPDDEDDICAESTPQLYPLELLVKAGCTVWLVEATNYGGILEHEKPVVTGVRDLSKGETEYKSCSFEQLKKLIREWKAKQ